MLLLFQNNLSAVFLSISTMAWEPKMGANDSQERSFKLFREGTDSGRHYFTQTITTEKTIPKLLHCLA